MKLKLKNKPILRILFVICFPFLVAMGVIECLIQLIIGIISWIITGSSNLFDNIYTLQLAEHLFGSLFSQAKPL